MKKIKVWLGKFKTWQMRLATYVSMVQFIMVFYIFIIESPMGLLWYHWFVLILCGISILMFIDIRFIMPYNLDYTFAKTPKLAKMGRDIEIIKDDLGWLKDHVER